MGEKTSVEWCDHTFNPWWGCKKTSPACAHCYAEGIGNRFGSGLWGALHQVRIFGDKHWDEPLRWNRKAEKAGVHRRVFCGSMCDIFEPVNNVHPSLRVRGSGPGGQNRNKRDTGVRITHEPSGAIGKATDQRTQEANKRSAFKRMTETKEFQAWMRVETARRSGQLRNIEREVDAAMAPDNLRVEVGDGFWDDSWGGR